MHLITEENAASRMLEPFGEVGGDVPEYFSSRTHFAKIEDKRTIAKNYSLRAGQLDWIFFNRSGRKISFVPGDSITI